MSENLAVEITQRFTEELERKNLRAKPLSRSIDPDFSGLTSEESLLLKAYRQLSPEAQEALLRLSSVYAKEVENKE